MRRAGADLAIVVALALVANFAYLVSSSGDFFYPDSATYLGPARNLLHGLGFASAPGRPETFRTPGYPLFLVPFQAVTSSAVPVLVAQHLLDSLMAAGIYLFCRRRFGSRGVGLLAGVIFALDPLSIHYANKVLSETLFTALLLLLLLWIDRIGSHPASWWQYAGAGALCGALILTRPVAILYFVLLGGWLLWLKWNADERPRAVRGVALFLLIAAAFPLGWALRNRLESGVFTVASVAGTNLLLYRAAGSLAILDDYRFKDALKDRQDELLESADEEIQKQLRIPDAEELDAAVRGQYYGAIGRRIALAHPFGLALVTLHGLMVNLLDSDWDSVMIVSLLPASLIQLTLDAWAAIVALLAIVGVIVLRRRDRPLAALLGLTIAYFLLISAGGESEGRFRVPVMPLMAIAGAAGARALCRAAVTPSPE